MLELKKELLNLEEQEENWKVEKDILIRKNKMESERKSLTKKSKISTTKLLVLFLFVNFTIVEIYSMWVMYTLADLSALYTLITAVIGETLTLAIYAVKSVKENTAGGIVYEQAMKESEKENGVG